MRDDQVYVFSDKSWWRLSDAGSSGSCPADFQWAFVDLPSRLAQNSYVLLEGKQIGGKPTVGIEYSMPGAKGERIDVTAWVDRDTGLTLHLDRLVVRDGQVVEHASADYLYDRKQ
jgi:hypothetical protein